MTTDRLKPSRSGQERSSRRLAWLTIPARIMLITGALVAVSLSGFAFYVYGAQSELIRENLQTQIKNSGELSAASVGNWLDGRTRLVEILAETLEQTGAFSDPMPLLKAKVLDRTFALTYFGDVKGNFWKTIGQAAPGYDARKRPWYEDALRANGTILTAPYISASTGRFAITAATPAHKADGALAGIVGTDIDIDVLVKMIGGIDLGGLGHAFLVSKDGKVLVHPEAEFVGKTMSELFSGGAPSLSPMPVDTVENGTESLTAFLPVPGLPPSLQWYIGLSAERTKVYAPLHALGRSALIASVVALLLVSLVLHQMLTRVIARPLRGLMAAMQRLASGDLSQEIAFTGRHDEVGQMAQAVEVFKTNALKARAVEEEAEAARLAAERERARTEAERADTAEQQAAVVAELARGLSGLAAGDLTGRVQAFPEDYKTLEKDFNAAIGRLQETIGTIAGNSQGIHLGTGEISQAADDLSKRTEQQAARLEETAAALDEITATVRKTAQAARHAREVVSTAKSDAEQSGQIVQDAVVAMGEIEKSSQEIGQIIGVIDEIAFQTNLLALNAGVEAARAGDAGKGFAVVAQEVRALAQRSAEAAKEIKVLIHASTGQVASGVNLVDQAGKALARIASEVMEINGIVTEIAASAEEQATGLNQVNSAVNQMDQVTQQNAAMVEETTAASHSLAQEAEKLAGLIGHFRVEAGRPAAASARVAAPIRRSAAPQPRRSAPAFVGNTAPALDAPAAEAGWDEF